MNQIGRRDYAERRASRVARLEARATKLRGESASRLATADRIADGIPFGQPILVGHHSEKRHRKDLERITTNTRRGIEAAKEAEACERRASASEASLAISSDDPEAVSRLRAKRKALEEGRDFKKRANDLIRVAQRKAKKSGVDPTAAAITALVAGLPCQESTAVEFMKPDFAGRVGFPAYELTNAAAEIRRIDARIAQLTARAAVPETELVIGDVKLVLADNRVQLHFPGKPSDELRAELKQNGFKWAPSVGAWQRMPSQWAWDVAKRIAARAAA